MIQINEDNLQIKGSNSYDEEEWNLGDESTNEHLVWSVKDFSSNIAQNTLITRKGKVRDIVNFKREISLIAETKEYIESMCFILYLSNFKYFGIS